jgi:dihydroflavonol-4-reductase
MTATVFLTGGTGFLGRHLLPMLCRQGYTIRLLTRHAAEHTWLQRYPRTEIVQGDVRDADIVHRAIEGCQYVIHAAGLFRFWGKDQDFDSTNVQGTQNMLVACEAAQTVQRFVHISTIAVIGEPDPHREMDETFPPNPVEPYQRSKIRGEELVKQAYREQGLPAIILRPGAYYGPLGEYAFNRLFFTDPMRGIIMQLNGGRYITFPVYISDVAQSVMLALKQGKLGETYNICGQWLTHKDVFDIVCAEAGLWSFRPPIPGWLGIFTSRVMTAMGNMIGREPFWPLNLRSYVYNYWRISNAKAQRELGFVPTTFNEGARQTIAWYRAGKPEFWDELAC